MSRRLLHTHTHTHSHTDTLYRPQVLYIYPPLTPRQPTPSAEHRHSKKGKSSSMEKRVEDMNLGEEEEGLVINPAPLEGSERILGENLCPAFLSNDSKAVDLFFNVVPGLEVRRL